MKNMMAKLKAKSVASNGLANSGQTGYLLMLSFFLTLVLVGMFAVNLAYDYVKNSAENEIDKLNIEQTIEDNEILSIIVASDEVSEYINMAVSYVKDLEKKLEEDIKFTGTQLAVFSLLLLLTLIFAPTTFKKSVNIDRVVEQKNVIKNIIQRLFASLLIIILLFENITMKFVSLNGFIKFGLQIVINLIILLLVYYLMIEGKKVFKSVLLASFLSSVIISLVFVVLSFLVAFIASGSVILTFVTYTILFMMSMHILVYIIYLAKEVGTILVEE